MSVSRAPSCRLNSPASGIASSADYPGYDKIIAGLAAETFESQVAKCAAWAGTLERILDTVGTYKRQIGEFVTTAGERTRSHSCRCER
jgi:hypothetical protein